MKKKTVILGLALTLLCTVTACNSKDKNKNPGSMANNSAQQESSVANNNSGNTDKDNILTENTTGTNSASDNITGTGGANPSDNVSIVDDVGDLLTDAADSITDITDGLFGNGILTDNSANNTLDPNGSNSSGTAANNSGGSSRTGSRTSRR